ncbi:MAG: hypothetical protein AB1757_23820 [Acidobacteriota bacterium]
MSEKLKTISGFGLIFLGVVGAVIPILPCIPCFIAAASLLGKEHPVIHPFASRLDRWRNRQRKKDKNLPETLAEEFSN